MSYATELYWKRKELGLCVDCSIEKEDKSKTYCPSCSAKHVQANTKNYQKNKAKVMDHYGRFCVCCKLTNIDFLTIDHVNGGGNEHRRRLNKKEGSKHTVPSNLQLLDIIRNNYPADYQIMCSNCNQHKYRHGYCSPELHF